MTTQATSTRTIAAKDVRRGDTIVDKQGCRLPVNYVVQRGDGTVMIAMATREQRMGGQMTVRVLH